MTVNTGLNTRIHNTPAGLTHPGQRTALPLTQMSFCVTSSHSGAEFEAGRLGHRNGEAPNGEDQAEDGREDCVRDCVCASGAVARAAPRRAHARARGIRVGVYEYTYYYDVFRAE